MKRTLLVLLALCLPALSACRAKAYRNDVAPQTLALLGAEAAGMEAPVFAGADELAEITGQREELPDIAVCYAADGNSLDEFGVWRAGSDDIKAAASLLRAYLSSTYENNRAYYDSYIPAETPKLRDAEVRVYGAYAVYAILSPESRERFFSKIETELAPVSPENTRDWQIARVFFGKLTKYSQ